MRRIMLWQLCAAVFRWMRRKFPCPIISARFDDLEWEVPGRSLSIPEARRIAAFIRRYLDSKVETVYCACDEGISRSSAIAAAVCRYCGISDGAIWKSAHYHPNMLVFRMLLECMDIPVSQRETDLLISINRHAYENSGRKGT